MKRIFIYLMVNTFFFTTFAQINNSIKIRFDGVYQTEKIDNYRDFIRFYRDGIVRNTAGDEVPEIESWFDTTNTSIYKGKYKIKNQEINFLLTGKNGSLEYSGNIINELKINFKMKSHINGYESEEIFTYYPYRNASLNSSVNAKIQHAGTCKDPRDNKVYKTVKIGTQIWMAQNLNYKADSSWCYLCEVYGRLYAYNEALVACPKGWHLPNNDEWEELINYLGGFLEAGGKMKEIGTTHWKSPNTGATNKCGFNALPSGRCSTTDNALYNRRQDTWWWSSTPKSSTIAYCYSINYEYEDFSSGSYANKFNFGQSVRCVKDK